jgi:integrase
VSASWPRFPAVRRPAHQLKPAHRVSYATAALAAGVPPKVISQRLGHATIAITMDTYSHVIPGLDEQAAETVARLILGDGEATADLSANKPLATGPGTD